MRGHLLALAPLLTFGSAAMAQTGLYIAEYQFENARLASIAADGTNAQEIMVLPPEMWLPLGLTYDAANARLIWMDSAGLSEVLAAPTAGGAISTLGLPAGFCRGVNMDASGRIYFSSSEQLQRLETDGSITPLYTSPLGDVLGMPEVDATNGHVYVNDAGQIIRVNLDGTNVKTIFTGCGRAVALGLDVAGGYIYWADADTNTDFVARVRLDGSGFEILHDDTPSDVSGSSGFIDLLIDPANNAVYYADELATTISKMALDGSGGGVIYTSEPGRTPSGLVLQTGEIVQPLQDCDGNGVADDVDIALGAPDCDNNGVIDTCQATPPCQRVFLLDNESDAANNQGRAVGVPSEWEIFQPFDVPVTWTVGEIGFDGYTVNYIDGSGIRVHLYPDDGSTQLPDETNELASTNINLLFNSRVENWAYAPLHVTLAPGRYWVVLEANDPATYGGSLNFGNFGEFSKSRGSSGNFTAPALPIAMRLVQGPPSPACPADLDGNSTVDVFDLLAYLDLWFAGDAAADLDGTAGVDVFDLLVYLDGWFVGCD